MNVEGVWKVEMLGPYGWETISTAFMQGGRYLGAGIEHYSIGSYNETEGTLAVHTLTTQHGKTRTVFGETSKEIDLRIECVLEGRDTIQGKAFPAGKTQFDVKVRLTRLGDLD